MKTRISPEVVASAPAIACTMRSCSSLLHEFLGAHDLPARPGAAAAETAAPAAKSAEAAAAADCCRPTIRRRPAKPADIRSAPAAVTVTATSPAPAAE